jgi:hypothetical protein
VQMTWDDEPFPPCPENTHDIVVMHHNQPKDEDDLQGEGVHYCPTMFLVCQKCFAIGEEPEPFECNRWGE